MDDSSDFEALDDTKASLRFLIMLLDPKTSEMERLELLDESEKANINRYQFYQVVKELKRLNLIEDTMSSRRGKKVITTRLTDKGREIANLVLKIKAVLEKSM